MKLGILITRKLSVIGFLLIATTTLSYAQSCPSDMPPPAKKPVIYEVQDQQLWQHDTETGKRTLVKDITNVQTVTQSVLNCSGTAHYDRSHKPNMVIVSKTDGTVWIRGVIWNYNFHSGEGTGTVHKPPVQVFNTKGQWKQIEGFQDVVKVAAAETWVAGLTKSRQVQRWGWENGSEFPIITKIADNYIPPLKRPVELLLKAPIYRDVVAYYTVTYGLAIDGQVTAAGKDYVCPIEAHRQNVDLIHACPFIYPQQGNVERLWQTPNNREQCNAQLTDGQLWQWPCDDREAGFGLINTPLMARIQKGKPAISASAKKAAVAPHFLPNQ